MSSDKAVIEIRDILHGAIHLDVGESQVIDSPYFQRLRQIRQLGFAEVSFPAATHVRFIHSLGAMTVASQALQSVFQGKQLPPQGYKRFRALLRLSALLHDIGHGPLSHTTEFAMPSVKALEIPGRPTEDRKATHEDYTLKILLDSELTPTLRKIGKPLGFDEKHVASLIDPEIQCDESFFQETVDGQSVSFKPFLQQLVSSELDADRMDYLRRDSMLTGVSYGHFDYVWLIDNLTYHLRDGKAYLALGHRGLYTFEDFMIARHHMFLMVYLHHKTVIFDQMLAQYLEDPACAFKIPASIDAYVDYDDAFLYSHLAQSDNPWAERISKRDPYRVLIELHSGIPVSSTREEQQATLDKLTRELEKRGVHYLMATSAGEFSKYYGKENAHGAVPPIYVKYDDKLNAPRFLPLHECTDLFRKYAEKRSITRIYVSFEDRQKLKREWSAKPAGI